MAEIDEKLAEFEGFSDYIKEYEVCLIQINNSPIKIHLLRQNKISRSSYFLQTFYPRKPLQSLMRKKQMIPTS